MRINYSGRRVVGRTPGVSRHLVSKAGSTLARPVRGDLMRADPFADSPGNYSDLQTMSTNVELRPSLGHRVRSPTNVHSAYGTDKDEMPYPPTLCAVAIR